jgi:serine protease Do
MSSSSLARSRAARRVAAALGLTLLGGYAVRAAAAPPAKPAPTDGACPACIDIPDLAEKVKPAVVNITTTQQIRMPNRGMDPFDFFFGLQDRRRNVEPRERTFRRSALGSGFIIDPSGYVVTNDHVVDQATIIHVRLADDRDFPADVVGRDPKLDLALLRLRGAHDLPTVPLGSSGALRVGESVVAVGNPFGLGNTVTKGIVSAKERAIGAGPYDDFIQTDASINPGNSGGPLFDARGQVVGINTAMAAGATGIGFAIPVDDLKQVLPQLRAHGHVDRARLGVSVQPVTPEVARALGLDPPQGALVADVEAGGPAAQAGLEAGDVVVAVDGQPIHHAEELPWKIASHAPGSKVTITVLRDKKRQDLTATLGKLSDEGTAPRDRK